MATDDEHNYTHWIMRIWWCIVALLCSVILGAVWSVTAGCASAPKVGPCYTYTYGCTGEVTCCHNDGKPCVVPTVGCVEAE